jgi:hypothetical protein
MITDRTAGLVLWTFGNTILLYIISAIIIFPFTTPDSPIRSIYPETPYIFFKLAAWIMATVLCCIGVQFAIVLANVDDEHFNQRAKKNFTEPS